MKIEIDGKIGQRWYWNFFNQSEIIVEVIKIDYDRFYIKCVQVVHQKGYYLDKVNREYSYLIDGDSKYRGTFKYLPNQDRV
jgi:hypothetical protein